MKGGEVNAGKRTSGESVLRTSVAERASRSAVEGAMMASWSVLRDAESWYIACGDVYDGVAGEG